MKQPIGPEISVIQKISTAIIHERNVEKLLDNVLSILDTEMGMLNGTFTLLFGNVLKIEASHGLDEKKKQLGQYQVGEGITGHVAETGRSHVIPDLRKDSRFLNRTESRNYDCQVAFICVPLIHDEQIIGTLSVDRPVDGATDLDRDVALLEIIANITGDAASECQKMLVERQSLVDENQKLRDMLSGKPSNLVGNCREMQIVYEQVNQVAKSDATALPENLVESELFGHEKGAFTGAITMRKGRAEIADGGTLFLDEIGDLTMQTQVKLLRFLQERTFSRVGSNEELHSNVRFLAATSRNLEELMAKKLFREDLFYRLNIFPISMPDLAKRHSDIILLAEHFIEKMNLKYGKNIVRLSTTAINLLMSYHWPGNVRELENCIERAVLTASDNCIHSYNLPPSLQTSLSTGSGKPVANQAPLDVMLNNYEKELITEAIKRNDGNISAAGRELGISPRMMNYRMNKLGMNTK